MGGTAGVLEGRDFVIERLPFRAENMRARDDHVDFVGAGFHRAPDFRDSFLERRKPSGESSGDRGNMNATSLDRVPSGFDEGVIHANGSNFVIKALNADLLAQFCLDWWPRLA